MFTAALNAAPLFWKQSVFVFLLGTYATFLSSAAPPPATALRLDVIQLLMQFVNSQNILINIFLNLNKFN
jgi:hypothetical protein